MVGLAQRLRRRFPQLTAHTYAPRRYPLIDTQVRRNSQAAAGATIRSSSSNRQPRNACAAPWLPAGWLNSSQAVPGRRLLCHVAKLLGLVPDMDCGDSE